MTAADRPGGPGFERDEHRPAPALDQACAERPFGGHTQWARRAARRQAPRECAGRDERIPATSSKRTATRAATSPSLRTDLHRRQLGIRLAWQIGAQIERLAACAACESGESETLGKLGADGTRAVKPITHPLVLVIDCAQRPYLVLDLRRQLRSSETPVWGRSQRVPPGTTASIR